jgi:hypothetical protein
MLTGCGGGPEAPPPAGTPATQSSQPSQTPAVQQAEAPSGSGAIAGFVYDAASTRWRRVTIA